MTPELLGNLHILPDADIERRAEDRRELMRLAACSALQRSRNGRDLDPEVRAWAKHWAAIKPLGRALGTGDPA